VNLRVVSVVFATQDQHLKNLPSKWGQGANVFAHVLLEVEGIDDTVYLELDAVFLTQLFGVVDLFSLVSVRVAFFTSQRQTNEIPIPNAFPSLDQ
jgi:hypothetical protein